MAKVSLRIYNQDISALIDQGEIEEAIAHCHHILKAFPKHLETYRLLGKAYLEAKRYNEASDIFSRVLMSVPNDFVSHVGMSLIADENKKQDKAIWHMERAFESQPSNAAVQNELQRLYGQRDGVQPPKVRMTNGALANIYLQGELYPQAIAEIRNVEAKDPGRLDMQVLLANAYFRSGQRVEASKIASDLLSNYPYCMDANRILVEILPGTSRAEDAEIYRQRVNALDPYAAFTKKSVFDTDEISDAAVSLEKLDWMPGSAPQLDTGTVDDEEPSAWTQAEDEPDIEPASVSEESTEEEEIPDFMRAAGWGTSSGVIEEPTSFFDSPASEPESESESEEIEKGELPDWMQEIAPPKEEIAAEENLDDDENADEWISDLLAEGEEDDAAEEKPLAEKAEDLPEWLQDEKPEEIPEEETSLPEEDLAALDPSDEKEDVLDFPKEADDAAIADDEDLPAWLAEEKPKEDSKEESSPLAEPKASLSEEDIAALGTSAEDQDAAMNWLESLAAKQGAKPEELITDPNARTEEAPEWVQKTKDASAEKEKEIEEPSPPTDEPLAWLQDDEEERTEDEDVLDFLKEADDAAIADDEDLSASLADEKPKEDSKEESSPPAEPETSLSEEDIAALGTSAEDQDAAMNWLESLAANQGAKPEELITDPNARTEEAPEWVQKTKDVMAEKPPAPEPKESPAQEEAQTEEEVPAPAESEMPSDNEIEKAVDADVGDTDDEEDDLAWLKEMETEQSQPLETESEKTESESAEDGEDLPAWLAGVDRAEDGGEADTEAASEADFPDWLAGELNPADEAPQPTDPSDWQPVAEDISDTESQLTEEGAEEYPSQPEDGDEAAETQMAEEKSFDAVSAKLAEKNAVPRKGEPPGKIEEEKTPEAKETTAKEEESPKTKEKKSRRKKRTDTTVLRDITLMGAQAAMDEGNVEAALEEYGKLIKKKRLLDETIYDLREALDEYPVNISIWQILGDAYMKAGRLQEAIDAYTSAEKLIR